jgi:UDP-glucose 4-epimerase
VQSCLVTGGCGFIGSHLVEALVARGDEVRVLDDLSSGKEANLAGVRGRVEIIRGSVTDYATVRKAVCGREVVYHLAALASVARSIEEPLISHEVCATGTLHVLDASRRENVRRVVYAASSSAYGDTPGMVRTEDDPLAPLSPYAAAKLAGEHYCRSFTTVFGLETVRLRFFNVFGPRQEPHSPYSGVIALFLAALADGRAPRIDGDGLQSRDFVYVTDVVQALLKAASAPAASGQVYNIGTGVSVSVRELAAQLNRLLGKHIEPVHGPPRPGDVRHSQADISRARRDLGYEPAVSLTDGLRRTLEAYLAQSGAPATGKAPVAGAPGR